MYAGEYLEFKKSSTKNNTELLPLYCRSKNNAKNVPGLPYVQQIRAQFGSMPVPTTHLLPEQPESWDWRLFEGYAVKADMGGRDICSFKTRT